jgi:hypothetical protein
MRLTDLITETVDTESIAFNLWFKGSKVVDLDDRPLICFHGTHATGEIKPAGNQHFGTFTAANDRIKDVYNLIRRKQHKTFPPDHVSAPAIYPVYLAITNPLTLNDNDEWHDSDVIMNLYLLGLIDNALVDQFENGEASETWIDVVKRLGYDGVTYHNEHEDAGSFSWYPFADHQVWNIFAQKPYS